MTYVDMVADDRTTPRKLKVALLALARFIDKTGRNDPTVKMLAEVTGYEYQHMQKLLARLAEAGSIRIERKYNKERRRANHYFITLPGADSEAA